MAARARLAGLRQDGTTFPVRVSLSPVPTATGGVIMAVIRDITGEQPRADLAELARAAAAAEQARRGQELLDRVVNGLFHVGLSLQAASDLPHEAALQQIADALGRLDDTIGEIRDQAFADQQSQGLVRRRGTDPGKATRPPQRAAQPPGEPGGQDPPSPGIP